MAKDTFKVTIEVDGTVTVTTDQISRPNHLQAEQVMDFLKKQLGGAVEVKARHKHALAHEHDHAHDHVHDHDHE